MSDSIIETRSIMLGVLLVISMLIFNVCFFSQISNIWYEEHETMYFSQLEVSVTVKSGVLTVATNSGFSESWGAKERVQLSEFISHIKQVSVDENIASSLVKSGRVNTFIVNFKVGDNIEYDKFKPLLEAIKAVRTHKYRISLL